MPAKSGLKPSTVLSSTDDNAVNSLDRNESPGSELSQTDDKLATYEQGIATFLSEEVQEKEGTTPTEFQEHAKVQFGIQTELFNL